VHAPQNPHEARRGGSAICSLRWSGQDHFDWRGGYTEPTEHSVLAVELSASISVSAETQVAVELQESMQESLGSVVLRK
jgi:hypothetical protein